MSTNLFGRGMDIERVNIVFNYDMPEDSDTYLHRVTGANEIAQSNVFDGCLCRLAEQGDLAQRVLQ